MPVGNYYQPLRFKGKIMKRLTPAVSPAEKEEKMLPDSFSITTYE